VKYGALSVPGGRVALDWALEADGRLTLSWVETCGPAVTPPTRRGFGSRLIERGLSGDLRGSASLRYEPGGLTCAMEARLSGPPTDGLNPFPEI
jgi:two-component sensor histidine kinase